MVPAQTGTPISVDTYHADTARRAVEAGASIINDVTGGNGDRAMFSTIAALGCAYILQHTRGTPETMNSLATCSFGPRGGGGEFGGVPPPRALPGRQPFQHHRGSRFLGCEEL